jgi:hypothetical protein
MTALVENPQGYSTKFPSLWNGQRSVLGRVPARSLPVRAWWSRSRQETQEFLYQRKHRRQGYAPNPAQIGQIWSRQALNVRRSWFCPYSSPSRLPDPHHLAALTRPAFSGLLPPAPGTSRYRLPSASPPCCDKVGGRQKVSHLLLKQRRLTAHVHPG